MATPVIDETTFAALRDSTDAEFVSELVDTYCDETPQIITQLQDALARGDADAFRRCAHSIKSSSNSLGALAFGADARELEMIGKAGSLAGVQPRVEALVAAYKHVEHALRELQHAG